MISSWFNLLRNKQLKLKLNIFVTAFKRATREQKVALELSAAKKERDFYMSKVDQSRASNAIEERLKKVQSLHLTQT